MSVGVVMRVCMCFVSRCALHALGDSCICIFVSIFIFFKKTEEEVARGTGTEKELFLDAIFDTYVCKYIYVYMYIHICV